MPPVPGLIQFILASESQRRVDLLNGVGYRFQTVRSGFDEVSYPDPKYTVEENAHGKATTTADVYPSDIVVGADTVVFLPSEDGMGEGELFGQPGDNEEARRMLTALQGRSHEVHTGVAVVRSDKVAVRHSMTRVTMRPLSESDIEAYVSFGEGIGKAGGYAIQGTAALFVERIEGDYTTVVGLPLSLTARMLEHVGVSWYETD
ncbi:Maf family protein [Rubrobacter indicoceani]|uniref:Maf family protein n=1 Tax=Rubrobacter indicoceani TaxID=2051957 RepID=UPI000E5B272E|nr:Maf family protein [Rubrobacter indicoceani]